MPHGQSLEVEQVEFTFGQGRAILRAHQQSMVDQGFGRSRLWNASKRTMNAPRGPGSLTPLSNCTCRGVSSLVAATQRRPGRVNRAGKSCRGQHAQVHLQALGPTTRPHTSHFVFL